MKSRHVFFALPFFTALGINSKADSAHDFKSNKDFGHTIVSELEAGQLDLLENQYQDFQGQTLRDGTSKFWVYFDAFQRTAEKNTTYLSELTLGLGGSVGN